MWAVSTPMSCNAGEMREVERTDDGGSVTAAGCSLCGAEVPDREWFGLEVQRPVANPADANDVEYRDEIFCSQEHAARWLEAPMDPPEPSLQFAGSGRKAGVLLACAAVALAGVFGVGLLTIGRWLLSLP